MVLETLVAPTVWSGLAVVSVGEPMGQPVTARVLEEMPCGFACPLASSWLSHAITILGMQGQLSCDNSSGTACGGMARR
eukprot:COSAG06_NODE_1404_length_9558_cov_191.769955_4_plen_79_part_00